MNTRLLMDKTQAVILIQLDSNQEQVDLASGCGRKTSASKKTTGQPNGGREYWGNRLARGYNRRYYSLILRMHT